MLKVFNKTNEKAGLVGLYATPEKLTLAHIIRSEARPELMVCEEVVVAGADGRADSLEKLVSDHDLEGLRTCFVLSPLDYKLLLVEAPKVEPAEMAGAVKWKIKDLLGHPVEEMAITVFDVPEGAYRSQSNMVYAVAARKNRIRDVIALVNGSGLELDVIDIPELAMMNLSMACADDSEGLAFLDLREDGSTLNLCRNGEIFLTRQLSTRVGGQSMSTQEWETIKDRLTLEIQRSLDYYQSQMGQSMVPVILLAPREHDADGLAHELGLALGVTVNSLKLSSCLDCQFDLPMAMQQNCMLAISGALRQEQGQKVRKPGKAQKAKAV